MKKSLKSSIKKMTHKQEDLYTLLKISKGTPDTFS